MEAQDYERAAQLKEQTDKIQKTFVTAKEAWLADKGIAEATIDGDDIAGIVSAWTGIPVQRMKEEEAEKLLKMEARLHARVIGQDKAVAAVSRGRAPRARRAQGSQAPDRLVPVPRPDGRRQDRAGPGAGRVPVRRRGGDGAARHERVHGEAHRVRLIGSPPGYVGYDEGGQLTEAVRRRPYSVVLFDEIEKAHPDVFNMLLQILDDGRLTDDKGRTVDFKNTVVIMTSNVGSSDVGRIPSIAPRPTEKDYDASRSGCWRRCARRSGRSSSTASTRRSCSTRLGRRAARRRSSTCCSTHLRRQVEGQGLRLQVVGGGAPTSSRTQGTTRSSARGRSSAPSSGSSRTRSRGSCSRGAFAAGDTVKVDVVDGSLVFTK